MNQDQYKHTKEYFIKYINKLLTKKRIIKKGFLKEIKKDLSTKGFINETIKYNFFLKFLQSDRNHNNINISDSLYSLETYSKQRDKDKTSTTTLEEFLT